LAKIYELDAYRSNQPSQEVPPLTRNQELLAGIQAAWAARTPDEIRMAEILGTQEELNGVQRRYDRLVEAFPLHLWPSEIAKANRQKPAEQDHSTGIDHGNGHDVGYSI
jgi:hypothetical protein